MDISMDIHGKYGYGCRWEILYPRQAWFIQISSLPQTSPPPSSLNQETLHKNNKNVTKWCDFQARNAQTCVCNRDFVSSPIHDRHFWQAPLRVRSAERRHQSPEWTVLCQVNCVVHIEVGGFQILLNGFHPSNTRTSQWSPPVSCGGSC